jgi:hypothetical protein
MPAGIICAGACRYEFPNAASSCGHVPGGRGQLCAEPSTNRGSVRREAEAAGQRILRVSFYKVGTITAKIGGNDNVTQAKEFFKEALNVADKYSGLDRQQLVDALIEALQQLVH